MKLIFSYLNQITSEFTYGPVITVFQKSLYTLMLGTTLISIPIAGQLWGPNSYITKDVFPHFGWHEVSHILENPLVSGYYHFFILGQILFLIFGLLSWYPLISPLLIWFFTTNLNNAATTTLNAGNTLIGILLIFLILIEVGRTPIVLNLTRFRGIQSACICIGNFAFYSARLQVAVVYFVSAMTKLQGELWTHGVAVYYVLQSDVYTDPWISPHLIKHDFFIFAATYGTLLFQLAFPWLVWFRETRPWVLMIGTMIHLQIAFLMGLTDFGIAMMVSYLLFMTNTKAAKVIQFWKNLEVFLVEFFNKSWKRLLH